MLHWQYFKKFARFLYRILEKTVREPPRASKTKPFLEPKFQKIRFEASLGDLGPLQERIEGDPKGYRKWVPFSNINYVDFGANSGALGARILGMTLLTCKRFVSPAALGRPATQEASRASKSPSGPRNARKFGSKMERKIKKMILLLDHVT